MNVEFFKSIFNVAFATFFLLFSSPYLKAQNDACNNAQVINLSTPNGCNGPNGNGLGTPTNVGFSFAGITAANPYLSMLGCSGAGDMSSPASDGWYQFVATGTNVSLSFNDVELDNLNVGIWTGNCGNLTALFCHNEDTPAANGFQLDFQPLVIGQTYYLQLSGGSVGDTDADGFDFNITPNNNCDLCLTSASLTVDPLPINGTYVPGQIVEFCFTIEDWEQQETNWFHGIQIDLSGSNWNNTFFNGTAPNGSSYTSAINPTINNTNDCGTGQFNFYPSGYVPGGGGPGGGLPDNSNIVFPGFYYESNSGCGPCSSADPSDNWGVSNAAGCNPLLQFCWTMQVGGSCPANSGASLNFTIGTTADGETGSWTSPACSGDGEFPFNAAIACCDPPVLGSTAVSCPSSIDGTVFVTNLNQTGSAPYTFFWYNSNGDEVGSNIVDPGSVQSSTTVSGLPAGDYSILIQNSTGCLSGASVTIASATALSLNPVTDVEVCAGTDVTVDFTSSQSPTYVQWTVDPPVTWLLDGNITAPNPFSLDFTPQNAGSTPLIVDVTVTPGNASCLGSPTTFQVIVNPAPIVTLSAPNTSICSGESVDITGSYSPQPVTNQITVENNTVESIPSGGCPGSSSGCDLGAFAGTTVTTSGISPATLEDGQLESICVTIRHECPTELTSSPGEVFFYANGVYYTNISGAGNSQIDDDVAPIAVVYNADFDATFDAALAAAVAAAPLGACSNNNPLTFTYCLPQSLLDIIESNNTASNGDWFFGIRDFNSGNLTGNITNTTIVINDYESYTYNWTNTTGLSNPVPAPYTGSTTGGDLTVTATPAIPGDTYTLAITDANGCSGSDDIAITVLPLPVVPTITPVTPICAGSNAVFNVTTNMSNANATITYNIISPTPAQNNETATLVANGSGSISIPTSLAQTQDVTIQLVSISNGSCSIPLSATYTVDVNVPTLPTFTQLGPYCQGFSSPGTLLGSSINGIAGTWSPATVSTAAPGTSTYTFTPNSGAAPTCATQATMDILINPTPVITPSATQVCLNQTVSWSGNGAAGSPAWSITSTPPGNATFSNTSANPVTITGTQVGNVTIQYVDNNLCAVTNTLTVLPLPTVTSLIPVLTPICNNTAAEWDVVGTPNSTITYTIDGGATFLTVDTDPLGEATISVSNATSDVSIELTSINNGSCSSSLNNTSLIDVIPAATMNNPTDIIVCGGTPNTYDPVPFVLAPAGSGYTESFQWTSTAGIGLAASGSGQIGVTSAPSNTTSDPIVGTVVVTPYLGGCMGASQDFTVTINPTPAMTTPTPLGVFCVGETIDPLPFIGNANAPVVTTYSWGNNQTGTGLVASGTDSDIPGFTATNAGSTTLTSTVTVTPSYTNGPVTCPGVPVQFSFSVDPVPVVNNQNPVICETSPGIAVGQNLTNNNGNIYSGASSYNWSYSGGAPVPDPTNEDVSDGEIFEVEVVTANGCINTALVTYTVTNGITVNSPTIILCENVDGDGTYAIADLESYNNNMFTGGDTYTWTGLNGALPSGPTTTPGSATVSNGDQYSVQVVQGACPVVTGTITFQVDGQVTAGTGGSIDLCSSGSAVDLFDELTGADTGGAWSGLSTLGNGDQGTFTPSTDLDGTYLYTVLSNNSCPNDDAAVAVTVTDAVYAGDGGAFQLCASATTIENLSNYNAASLGAITAGGSWTVNIGASVADPGAAFNSVNGTIDPTGLPLGDYVFEYAVTPLTAACPSEMAVVTLTIIGNIVLNNPSPVLCESSVGSGQYVNLDLTTLNNSVFTGGDSYTWTGGNTQSVSDGQSINVQVVSGTCVNSIGVTFTVEPLPTAVTVGSGSICENDPFTLPGTAASASNGTVNWIVLSGNGSITSGGTTLTPTYTPDASDAGNTVTLEMTVTSDNTACTGLTATANYDIQVLPLPLATTTPVAPVSICSEGGSYQLQVGEASALNGTVVWTHDGNGTLTGTTSLTPNYVAVASDAGNTVTLTMTVTSNNVPCAGETAIAIYTINVDQQPTASAVGSATICEGTDYTLVASEANSSNGTVLWTHDGFGGLTDETTLTPTYTPDPSDAGTTVTLLMTVSNGGACPDATAQYSVIINPLPLLTITDPNPSCAPFVVDITLPSVTAGSEPGTITYWNDNPPTDPMTVLEAQGVSTGIYYIQLEALNCTSILPVSVTVNSQPTFTFDTLTPSACNLTDGNITLFGLNVGSAYDVSVFDGTDNTVTTMNADPSGELIIPNLGSGSYEVSVVLLSSNCGSDIALIEILNPGAPILDNPGPQTLCDTYTLPVIGGSNLSGSQAYYNDSQANGGSVISGPITTSQTVYIYDTQGSCSDEESFVVTINNTPAITNPGAQTACATYTLPTITGTNISAGAAYYDDTQSNGGSAVTGPITTSQTVWIYDANGACSDETSFVVTINALPTVSSVDGGATYCAGDPVTDVTAATTGTGPWTVDYTVDGVAQTANGATSPITLGNTAGVYVVTNVTDANCTNAAAGTQTITVNPIPLAPTAGADTTYCASWTLVPMTATGGTGTMTWYDDAGLTGVITTGGSLTPFDQTGTTVYYVTETAVGCEGPASMVMITIENCNYVIPTAFTPNADGVHDDWEIYGLDAAYPNNVVRIYNRWGGLLYEHDSSTDGPYDSNRWKGDYKGKALPVGSYYYIIELNDEDKKVESGAVSILVEK